MELAAAPTGGRLVIQRYGGGGFVVANRPHAGSLLIFPDRALAWPVTSPEAITLDSLANVPAAVPPVQVLVIGCGARGVMLPPVLRAALRERGIVVEAMDTGAACRTYNVLVSEDRRVAAALIAIA